MAKKAKKPKEKPELPFREIHRKFELGRLNNILKKMHEIQRAHPDIISLADMVRLEKEMMDSVDEASTIRELRELRQHYELALQDLKERVNRTRKLQDISKDLNLYGKERRALLNLVKIVPLKYIEQAVDIVKSDPKIKSIKGDVIEKISIVSFCLKEYGYTATMRAINEEEDIRYVQPRAMLINKEAKNGKGNQKDKKENK